MSLDELIADFRHYAQRQGWDTPGGARNQCGEATDDFIWFVEAKGFEVDILYCTPEEPEGFPLELDEHWFYHMCNIVTLKDGKRIGIDWTARQIEEDAPFPLVWDVT